MKQIKDMPGICKYCDGYCLRVEQEKFKSVFNCVDFQPAYDNWYEDFRKELKDGFNK